MLDGSATTGGALRFQLLGPVRAWRGEQALDLGSPQQVAVACVLLLHAGRPVTTQQLIDALWGEEPPPRAVGALRTYVSRLRGVIEPERAARAPAEVLVSVADGYALRIPEEAVDALAFEQALAAADEALGGKEHAAAHKHLSDALALWEGVPLAGVTGPYADGARDRFAERRLRAQELRLETELALGRAAETVAELTALVAEHPLRERLRGLLMVALYRSGRQAEALGVYTDTRRLLVDELGVEPGPELAALHARMLDGDPELAPQQSASEPVAGPPLRPAQLPTDIADFTGRSRLVAELQDALRASEVQAVAISALAGIGGVGKTTLAVHAAHRLRAEFPDGQLYADLRGAGSNPADPGTVLGDFLRGLGVPAREVPDGTGPRSALYRTLLADRRILVMLDNARDPSQVRPLLPGTAGCAVVITSRARMAGLPGVRPFDVDVLEEDEALELFAAIAGEARVAAEPEAARAVLAACSRLPLAIRIVASRLAARPGWTVASLAERLRDQRRRLDELHVGDLAVEATFHLGYTQLDPEQARAFRLLAIPDGPDFSVATAAAVLGTDPYAAEDIAESLVDVGLLEAPEPGRYRFHDLIRLYARRQAEREAGPDAAAETDRTLLRLLGHVQATVATAYQLLEPGDVLTGLLPTTESAGCPLESADAAHAWLAAEHACLLAVTEQAVGSSAAALRPVADLYLLWVWLIETQMYRVDFQRVLDSVIAAAQRAGDPVSESRARYALAYLAYSCGDYGQAEHQLRDSLGMLGGAGDDDVVRYGVVALLGIVLSATNRPGEAIPLLREARELCEGQHNELAAAVALGNLARAYVAAGDQEQARAAAGEAVAIARRSGNLSSISDTLYQRGIVLRRTARPEEAAEHLSEALALYQRQQRRRWEGLTLARLAECHLDTGTVADAVACAEQALTIGRETGAEYCQGLAQAALGLAFVRQGETERGRSCLAEAHAIFSRINVPESAAVLAVLDGLATTPAPASPQLS